MNIVSYICKSVEYGMFLVVQSRRTSMARSEGDFTIEAWNAYSIKIFLLTQHEKLETNLTVGKKNWSRKLKVLLEQFYEKETPLKMRANLTKLIKFSQQQN